MSFYVMLDAMRDKKSKACICCESTPAGYYNGMMCRGDTYWLRVEGLVYACESLRICDNPAVSDHEKTAWKQRGNTRELTWSCNLAERELLLLHYLFKVFYTYVVGLTSSDGSLSYHLKREERGA